MPWFLFLFLFLVCGCNACCNRFLRLHGIIFEVVPLEFTVCHLTTKSFFSCLGKREVYLSGFIKYIPLYICEYLKFILSIKHSSVPHNFHTRTNGMFCRLTEFISLRLVDFLQTIAFLNLTLNFFLWYSFLIFRYHNDITGFFKALIFYWYTLQ